jgi:Na+-transporting NADH:ubiquinone oxidoreductase subunit E
MENLFDLFVRNVFTENMVFAYFLGMCSYLAVSKTVKTAVGLGIAVIFVIAVTVPVNWLSRITCPRRVTNVGSDF